MTPARAGIAAGVVVLVLSHSTASSATFTSTSTGATAGFVSDILQPASAVNASCTRQGQRGRATVTWTASTSPYVTGYSIGHTGASTDTTSTARSPATFTQLVLGGSYTFTVTATFRGWTSPSSSLTITC